MRFGFHIPISGGLDKVPQRAIQRHCETIQIFTRSPRLWRSHPLEEKEVGIFKAEIREADIQPVVVHTQYLVNLASADSALWRRSWQSLAEDLRRARTLGAEFVVVHPGSRGNRPVDEAIRRVGRAIRRALAEAESPAQLLLENTAGGGGLLGGKLEELSAIADATGLPEKVGFCLDTAHAYEAGHDIASEEGLEAALAELDRVWGLEKLKVVHANESATPLGSHRDRHWDIAQGYIGEGGLPPVDGAKGGLSAVAAAKAGFRLILSHPKLLHLPFIMETPTFELERDLRNMATIRRLAGTV